MSVKLNLNLDKPTSIKPVQVFHSIHYKGSRFRLATGQSIEPKHWDKDNQEVRRTRTNFGEYNRIFTKQRNTIEKVVLDLEDRKQPVTKENICTRLDWLNAATSTGEGFTVIDYYKKFVSIHCKAESNAKQYNTTLTHLSKYQEQKKITLSFAHFDKAFYSLFIDYLLNDAGMFNNAAGNHIKHLKTFLGWAVDQGHIDTIYFKDWKVTHEENKAVFFLQGHEIELLATLECEPRLQKVRDLFLVACYTGLRYSDLVSLKPYHLQEGFILKAAKKGGEDVRIPVIPELATLLNNYWGNKKPLPNISNQKGNNYIKEIVKLAGINREFIYKQKKINNATETVYKAYEMASWHTARHSFVTNCLQLGISPEVVRQVVGHATFKMMRRYIQTDNEFNKTELMKLSKKTL